VLLKGGLWIVLGTSRYALTRSFASARRLVSKLTYLTPFFLSFFLILNCFYLLIVGVFGYCWSISHSMTHTLVRTPLDEGSARRRDLYVTAHNTHNRQTPMSPARFEPAIPAGERPQTHQLDSAPTGNGIVYLFGVYCLRTVRIEYLHFNEIGLTLWPDEPTFGLWAFSQLECVKR
jgi:hypothetical protein